MALVWLFWACVAIQVNGAQLLQVFLVTRHGSRTTLTKQAASLAESRADLTPMGREQLYALGQWTHARYQQQLPVVANYTEKVNLVSSDTSRTLESAMALALGLFPKPAVNSSRPLDQVNLVPVRTMASENDVLIRPYDKCPAFSEWLGALYNSSAFAQQEKDNMELLVALAASFPKYASKSPGGPPYVRLMDVWNIFDPVNVAKTEQPGSALAKVLNDEQWQGLSRLAFWAEHQKYGHPISGTFVGANLVRDIIQKMISRVDTNTTTPDDDEFVLYSAHYPTLLGMFASLNVYNQTPNLPIPNYGAALFFELYKDGSNFTVRTFFKDGGQTDVTPLKLAACGDFSCPFATIRSLLNQAGLNRDQVAWCRACRNQVAGVCKVPAGQALPEKPAPQQSCPSGPSLWWLLIIVPLLLLCAVAFYKCIVVADGAQKQVATSEESNLAMQDLKTQEDDGESAVGEEKQEQEQHTGFRLSESKSGSNSDAEAN